MSFHVSAFGARPVHLIITMIKCIRTNGLSIKKSLSSGRGLDSLSHRGSRRCRVPRKALASRAPVDTPTRQVSRQTKEIEKVVLDNDSRAMPVEPLRNKMDSFRFEVFNFLRPLDFCEGRCFFKQTLLVQIKSQKLQKLRDQNSPRTLHNLVDLDCTSARVRFYCTSARVR